jgi:hypothetical protein
MGIMNGFLEELCLLLIYVQKNVLANDRKHPEDLQVNFQVDCLNQVDYRDWMRTGVLCSFLPDHLAIGLIGIIYFNVSLIHAKKPIKKRYNLGIVFKNRWRSVAKGFKNIYGLIFKSKVFFTEFQVLPV